MEWCHAMLHRERLTRLQEEHVVYLKRIDKEKKRREKLDADMETMHAMLRGLQDKTNNGQLVSAHHQQQQKLVTRREHSLQTAKVKLSTARSQNMTLKLKVDDLRREKMLQLQILNDLNKEGAAARRRCKFCAKEVQHINEKKHKAKLLISNLKGKMVREMEDFNSKLDEAKNTLAQSHNVLLTTIRDKLASSTMQFSRPNTTSLIGGGARSMSASPPPLMTTSSLPNPPQSAGGGLLHSATHSGGHHGSHHSNAVASPLEIESLLKETAFKTVYDLLKALQQSEESIFTLYHETQGRHEEVEKMELENKHLEQQVQEQMKRLQVLEGNQEQVKVELEQNILQLKAQMARYDADYAKNMEIIAAIREPILSVLKNVAVDEEALDQQLLSTGITDRNILDFLAIIEQRIDELIQMVKAANHQPIRREDFMRSLLPPTNKQEMAMMPSLIPFQAPIPPSMDLGNAEDDDDQLYNEDSSNNNINANGNINSSNANNASNTKGFSIQPLNVAVLKEIVMKKLQKATLPNPSMHGNANTHTPFVAGVGGGKRLGSYMSATSSHQMSTSSMQQSISLRSQASGSSINSSDTSFWKIGSSLIKANVKGPKLVNVHHERSEMRNAGGDIVLVSEEVGT
eukprot:scaffold1767_cov178-Ochromonas_danica.AAC.29